MKALSWVSRTFLIFHVILFTCFRYFFTPLLLSSYFQTWNAPFTASAPSYCPYSSPLSVTFPLIYIAASLHTSEKSKLQFLRLFCPAWKSELLMVALSILLSTVRVMEISYYWFLYWWNIFFLLWRIFFDSVRACCRISCSLLKS